MSDTRSQTVRTKTLHVSQSNSYSPCISLSIQFLEGGITKTNDSTGVLCTGVTLTMSKESFIKQEKEVDDRYFPIG